MAEDEIKAFNGVFDEPEVAEEEVQSDDGDTPSADESSNQDN